MTTSLGYAIFCAAALLVACGDEASDPTAATASNVGGASECGHPRAAAGRRPVCPPFPQADMRVSRPVSASSRFHISR